MHECFLNVDHKGKQWFLAVDCMPLADCGIPDDTCFARNAQSISMSGHNEQERHIWVFEEVLKPINPVIAKAVRDDQRLVIVDFDKTCWVPWTCPVLVPPQVLV
jgi:hypothetical protein